MTMPGISSTLLYAIRNEIERFGLWPTPLLAFESRSKCQDYARSMGDQDIASFSPEDVKQCPAFTSKENGIWEIRGGKISKYSRL